MHTECSSSFAKTSVLILSAEAELIRTLWYELSII